MFRLGNRRYDYSKEEIYDYDYNYDQICDMSILEKNNDVILEYIDDDKQIQVKGTDEYIGKGILSRKLLPFKSINGFLKWIGIKYYEDGAVQYEGILQKQGLYMGKCYYPSGKLKFIGKYNECKDRGGFSAIPHPVEGTYYAEDGTIIYSGKFQVKRLGSMGYPKVVKPEGYKL